MTNDEFDKVMRKALKVRPHESATLRPGDEHHANTRAVVRGHPARNQIAGLVESRNRLSGFRLAAFQIRSPLLMPVHTKREEVVEGGMVTGTLYRIAVLSLWASLCSNTALATPCDKGGAQAQGRPRIGLVLGGGGARGAAHVGVLK